MFLNRALVALFAAWTISVAANPITDPLPDDARLPDTRLSPLEVRALKEAQKYPPGYVHKIVTLGTGENAKEVPIVEADPDMLLHGEKGIKARSLARRGSCMSFPSTSSGCMIDYCWKDNDNNVWSRFIIISGSNGKSNPSSVRSSDPSLLSFNSIFNNGYGGWFPEGHECSNSDTQIYTDHSLSDGITGTAYINRVRCDNCNFGFLNCLSDNLKHNLIAYSNGVSSQSQCI
ncbi:secreted in xylem 2 [Fusarium mundagurra]|uniref:Secreted in xylem 2 n=1 Tax=Fusarium mundagurra TaxID=1567541 RepID=A0A8H6DFS0_9HYPO|nr:secreted in xylem 2 [Fusarium mundagurra]